MDKEVNKNMNYQTLETPNAPIKHWTNGVVFAEQAKTQLYQTASMPFIHNHIAVMPDVHLGKGCSIGSVIPTVNAIIPSCVGVDLGCGMIASKTELTASDLPDNLSAIRSHIEAFVPHGRTANGKASADKGAWKNIPDFVARQWNAKLAPGFAKVVEKAPRVEKSNHIQHLGSLGGGNHFIELCLDESDNVWIMLHSGSRGVGNSIATDYINRARKDMESHERNLPNRDLAYLEEGTEGFNDYIHAIKWAQDYAKINREIMLQQTHRALEMVLGRSIQHQIIGVNCHHNYVDFSFKTNLGQQVYLTRKGAISARKDELGIIPGSMGAKSYIVRGLGSDQSWHSCSHGAGRVMSRTQAKKSVDLESYREQIKGVECRLDGGVIDESPCCYKDIDQVMSAQNDLVEIVHMLKQVVCVKG